MVDIGISKMKSYLANAIECEKNVYIWSEAMKRVNGEMKQLYEDQKKADDELQTTRNKIDNLNVTYKGKEETKVSDSKKFLETSKRHKRRCVFMVLLMPLICFVWGVIAIPIIKYSESGVLTALACLYFLAFLEAFPIILFIINKKNIKKYVHKSIEISQTDLTIACDNEERQLVQQKDELVERCAWLYVAEQCVTEWQDEIHKSYRQALSTRKKLYSLNVLDARFQNFFCVTTFYDYIQTGRVVTVNGYGGLAATLDRDQKYWQQTALLADLRAIAEDTNKQQRYLVEQAREANKIQQQISDQISSLNRNVEYLSAQQARTADAANRIDSQLRYGY